MVGRVVFFAFVPLPSEVESIVRVDNTLRLVQASLDLKRVFSILFEYKKSTFERVDEASFQADTVEQVIGLFGGILLEEERIEDEKVSTSSGFFFLDCCQRGGRLLETFMVYEIVELGCY
jgi:hypothetical protein